MKIIYRYIGMLFTALAILVGAGTAEATAWKVLEQSEKKIPEWVGTLQKDAIQVEYEAPSLREAEEGAIREVQRRIIMAVATNVSFQSLQTSSERLENDRVDSRETLDATTEIAAAKLPFIKGVTLTEARASFWQKVEEKGTRRTLYRYTLLYPLTERELADMRRQFRAIDDGKAADLERLREGIGNVSSVEELAEADATLSGLEEYFFDKVRKQEATALRKRYADTYRRLALNWEQEGEQRVKVSLLLDGRPFRCGARPTVTSDCATGIRTVAEGDGSGWIITYSSEDCLPTEQNFLNFTLRIKTARLNVDIPIH